VNAISQEASTKEPKQTGEPASSENLALQYQGLLTGIIRIKSQRQHVSDGASFRRRTKAALQEVERVAAATGYENRDVRDTHLAVVAFLDTVVLHSKDPVRAEWERMPLALELFGYADAGVVFFEKLEQFRARRNSAQLADVLEVYLLCLLLGYEGRYSGGQRGELDATMDSLQMRIDDIRGPGGRLSPDADLPYAAAPAPMAKPRKDILALVTLGLVIVTIICFVLLKWDLLSTSAALRYKLF
jgi:type VI secretion system protein ImpK